MRNLLLSTVLIVVPVTGFTVAEIMLKPPEISATVESQATSGLGDLSAYETIVRDTQRIVATGDFVAAEKRITDLETLWDDNTAALRKADLRAWNTVDAAADAAFAALRARTPKQSQVAATLSTLQDTLKAPVQAVGKQPVKLVAGIPVSDETGRALPCEDLIAKLRNRLAGTTPSHEVSDLQSKALERCNADDDERADAFAAKALSLIKG